MLEHGDLDMGHARCLLMLDESQQYQVAQLVVAKNLSVRETEALVSRVKAGDVSAQQTKVEVALMFEKEIQTLAQKLQTKVKIKSGKAGKGMLIIHYNDRQTLQQMIGQLISEGSLS